MIKLSSSGHSQNHVTAPHRLSNNLRSSFVRCDLIQKRKRNRKLCALSFTKTFRVYLALMTLDDMSRGRPCRQLAELRMRLALVLGLSLVVSGCAIVRKDKEGSPPQKAATIGQLTGFGA